MKKLLTIMFTLLIGASLSFAQATGSTPANEKAPAASSKKTTKTKAHHKGGKKGKKGSSGTQTPAPK